MENHKKVILFGDYEKAKWHPLKGVDEQIQDILREDMSVVCTEDYGKIKTGELNQYDLCISYFEFTDTMMTKEQVHTLLSYVSGGGGLLVIHNGISLQSCDEFSQMVGARFTGHPDYKELPQLQYSVKAADHPVMEGIEDFAMGDEPYQFIFEALPEKTLLLEYKYEDAYWPAAWALSFGAGKVVYLAPGHRVEGFKSPAFRRMIYNSAKWAARAWHIDL